MLANADGEEVFYFGRLQQVTEPTADAAPVSWVKASIVALKDPDLGHRSLRVLLALESYCWGADRESWATNRTIGLRAGGIGKQAVRLAMRELEKLGYLRVETDPKKWRGSRIVLLYRLIGPDSGEQP